MMYEVVIKINTVLAINNDVEVKLDFSTRKTKTLIPDPDAIIYRYVFPNGKSYVGQTKRPEKRKQEHINDQKTGEQNGFKKPSCKIFYLAVAALEGKWRDVKYEVLLHCKRSTAAMFENRMMAAYNSVTPFGYNQHSATTILPHTEETKLRQSISNKKGAKTRLEKCRKHEELKGMPLHVIYIGDKKREGMAIRKHPHCTSKNFLHYHKNGPTPWAKIREETLTFYKTLPLETDVGAVEHKSVQKIREEKGLVKGTQIGKNGITVLVGKVVNKKSYSATFNSNDLNFNKLCALAYLQILIIKVAKPAVVAKQKECSSETKWQSAYTDEIKNLVLSRLKI